MSFVTHAEMAKLEQMSEDALAPKKSGLALYSDGRLSWRTTPILKVHQRLKLMGSRQEVHNRMSPRHIMEAVQ